MSLTTPVAFIIFRRPDLTQRVFAEIARAKPAQLFVIADGPRTGEERESCEAARAIVATIDWPCDVRYKYSDENLGCKRCVSSGIDWVFEHVEQAIILEDDCLPHPDFFKFCETMLSHYRDDVRVGHIAGTDYNRGAPRGEASYYFSRYTSIWGWATWRRAWKNYDVDMSEWPRVKEEKRHFQFFGTQAEAEHFDAVWDDIHAGVLDTWDGQWLFANLLAGQISISPNGNLISNLGCRQDATHTVVEEHPFAELPIGACHWPLRHPAYFSPDDEADFVRAKAEFLRKPPAHKRIAQKLSNKHFYGQILRALPVLGPKWAKRRG